MSRRGGRRGGGLFSFIFRLAIIAAVIFGGYVLVDRAGGINAVLDNVAGSVSEGVDAADRKIMGEGSTSDPKLSEERQEYLDNLTVSPAGDIAGFTRAKFLPAGYGAADSDGPCTILRQSILVENGSNEDCSTPAGPWIDHFTDEEISDTEDVMVSALVPWDKLWTAGASDVTDQRRAEMASDRENIVLSSTSLDRNGRSIDQWTPKHDVCGYADGYARILSKNNLSITESERAALLDIWGRC